MFFIFPRMAPSRAKGLLLLWATINTKFVKATPTPTKTTSSPPSSATGLSLSSDVTSFIPSCALSCFESFVEINYNISVCGTSPSLECLCQHTGSTGYTVGEGATECIVAENDINNCRNDGYGSETVTAAYGMCNNITNAAPETHATLVATLIVNSGSIVVATPTTTHSVSTNQSSTSIVMTPTPTSTSSSMSTTVAPAAATSTTAAATTSTAAPNLTQAQIGGIAGGIAAVALLAALLALFILLRRRAQRNSPAFSRMRDSWSPKRTQGSPGGGSLSISQPRYQEPKVMSFTRALAKRVSNKPRPHPDTAVGLAISPTGGRKPGTGVGLDQVVRSPVGAPPLVLQNVRSEPPPPPVPPMSPARAVSSFNFFPHETPAQQAPPTRPTLARLAIPQRASMHGGRDSVITEFAEDGEDGLGSAQIWRPPNTDPQSASTYYVADKWGNWVLRDQRTMTPPEAIAELATPISKTAEERAREEEALVEESAAVRELRPYSSPTIPEAVALPGQRASRARGGKPTIRLVTPESGQLSTNARTRDSVPANNNSNVPQQIAQEPNITVAQPATMRGSSAKGPRKRRKSDGTRRPPSDRQGSRDSATTIMSQDSATTIADSPIDDMINAVLQTFPLPSRQASSVSEQQQQQQGDLSPVLESPGRSPVQYPAIPRSQSIITVNKRRSLAPRPLPNPVLAKMKQSAAKPLNDSPTLGLVEPARRPSESNRQGGGGGHPNAHTDRNASAGRTGASPSSHTRKPSDIALLPSQNQQARSARMSSYDAYNDPSSSMYTYRGVQPPGQHRPPPQQYRTASPGRAYGSPPPPARTLSPPQQRTLSPQGQQPYLPSPPSASDAPSHYHYHPSGAASSSTTNPSMNSALLAKRLGAQRAAEFQRIEQQQQQQQQKKQKQQRYVREQDTSARQEASHADGQRYVELPATPGWKPQLTPKRKGDDLYLSVK